MQVIYGHSSSGRRQRRTMRAGLLLRSVAVSQESASRAGRQIRRRRAAAGTARNGTKRFMPRMCRLLISNNKESGRSYLRCTMTYYADYFEDARPDDARRRHFHAACASARAAAQMKKHAAER